MIKPRNIYFAAIMLTFIILVAGCIKPEHRSVSKRQFLIEAERTVQATRNIADKPAGVLEVQRFGIVSRFEGKGLVYKIGAVEYESDFYNEFLTAPQSMITEVIYTWLTQAGLFDSVVYADSRLRADYILEGNILALYGDFTDPEGIGQAVMEIQFFLIDEKQHVKRKLLGGAYRSTQEVETRTATDLVRAYNLCLENILRRLERDIQASL